jgi:cytoplasmic iron level regulating protein YaaA (DUF328/UPF0246 family)
MLIVLSPAKSLDFSPGPAEVPATQPQFQKELTELSKVTRKLSRADLRGLMSISEKLADLNFERFKSFDAGREEGVQAALAFAGDVYDGLDARSLSLDDLSWAQDRVRILSGLYGLLRPLDAIQPYRLEMGTRLATKRGSNLYDFWGPKISQALNAAVEGHEDRTLVNLASQEYFGAVDAKALKIRCVNVRFLETKEGQSKIISFFAKRARGLMARWAIDNRVEKAGELKGFDAADYRFDGRASSDGEWVFVRPHPSAVGIFSET